MTPWLQQDRLPRSVQLGITQLGDLNVSLTLANPKQSMLVHVLKCSHNTSPSQARCPSISRSQDTTHEYEQMWGLQGGSSRGLTAADVVNDGAKTARVRIDGAVNGVPFVVERSTRR